MPTTDLPLMLVFYVYVPVCKPMPRVCLGGQKRGSDALGLRGGELSSKHVM